MKALVLMDDRIGSSKQALALAELMGFDYRIHKLEYTCWAGLPNFVPFISSMVAKNALSGIKDFEPSIIISAGRRAARAALYMRDKKYKDAKLIQILSPCMPYSAFDAVIVPWHDNISSDAANIVRVDGAVVYRDEVKCSEVARVWGEKFKDFGKPRISVLIGGDTKNGKLSSAEVAEVLTITSNFARQISGTLFVTNSRRTSDAANAMIYSMLDDCDIESFFYDCRNGGENPYDGMLECTDYIVLTADSISMCAEAISTGKPVIVYVPEKCVSHKHKKFIEKLISDMQVNVLKKLEIQKIIKPRQQNDSLKRKLQTVLSL